MQPLSGYVLSVFIIEYADRGKVHRHYPLTSGIIFLMTSRYHVDPHDRSLDIVFLCLLVFLSAPRPYPTPRFSFFSAKLTKKEGYVDISFSTMIFFFRRKRKQDRSSPRVERNRREKIKRFETNPNRILIRIKCILECAQN